MKCQGDEPQENNSSRRELPTSPIALRIAAFMAACQAKLQQNCFRAFSILELNWVGGTILKQKNVAVWHMHSSEIAADNVAELAHRMEFMNCWNGLLSGKLISLLFYSSKFLSRLETQIETSPAPDTVLLEIQHDSCTPRNSARGFHRWELICLHKGRPSYRSGTATKRSITQRLRHKT